MQDPNGEPVTDGAKPERSSRLARLRKGRAFGCLIEIVETVVLTVVIFFGIQAFVAQPFKVEGGSMESTLLSGQYVLIDKLTPHWAPYTHGDIIVLDPPGRAAVEGGAPYIKRVVGLPGDRVELRDGMVYLNGSVIDEPYVFTEDGVRQPTEPSFDGPAEWLVPEGRLFVLGDHRRNSSDSRMIGTIEISHVIGRAWLRYWPIDAFGTLSTETEGVGAGT